MIKIRTVSVFLGIDGGGSKTTCAVGDEKSVLATATGGGSNLIRVGEAQARESLHSAVQQACAGAGVDPRNVQQTCIGVAGAARPEIADQVRHLLSEIVSGEINVVGDMVIALEAAFGKGPGIIVIAGTGSIAYGRNEQGEAARAGGWGFAISDEGSGHWIGRSALSATMRAQDVGEKTELLGRIQKFWQLSTIDDVVRAANALPARDFSSLFPLVLSAAGAGDALASRVLSQAGAELAELAKIAIRRLFPNDGAVPVAMAGGVFRESAFIRQVFYNTLRSFYPAATVKSTVIDPVLGALELARKTAGKGTMRVRNL